MLRHHRTLLLFLSLLFCVILISACGSKEEPASEQPDIVAASPDTTPEMSPETTEKPVTEQESPSEKPTETESPADNPKQTSTPAATPAVTDKPKAESTSSVHTGEHSSGETDSPEKDDTPKKTASPQSTPKPTSPPADTPSSESTGEVHVVEIVNFGFSPSELTIKAGDTVKFINKDAVGHSATANDDSFDTGMLEQDKAKEVTFSKDGEFSYYCLPHPGMKGTIVVEAK
ncbi:cupredoxin domain-containing protein [Paenibacillus prosopidis]|uniref:Plastocyanin n=1 Tax=Paenibacillus prosopidis TaxID=630520 RepID=A0A368W4D3_9BACL|nr:cupredoxin family copper-binding protein [Paenibacillus prosopidis]RCW49158.1 plastocyanin [Paenibacillus prosopidis]